LQAGNGSGESQDAANYLTHRFGPTAGACLTRVLEKFYGLPAAAMHESATCQPAMNRVVLYGEETLEPLLSNQKMRAVIAWPDQLTLPVKRDPPQSGFYPKRFGFNRVIDAAVHQLSTDGVRILFNRSVTSLERSGNHIISVTLDDGSTIQKPGLVVSANGLQASLALLRQPGEAPLRVPAPPRSWMVFLRINEPPQMGRLYHFWCFDEAFRTFRVTNYCGYCPDARTEAGYPLCVELWSSDEDAAQATRRAIQELRQMEVLNGAEITAQAALPGANMHALRTLETVQQLRALRTEVKERSPANMITVGPFIEDEVMLLYEVWRKMYPMIAERL
jgi:hypothetical protein